MFLFKTGASLLMAGVTVFGCVAPALASNIWDESYTHNTQEGSDSNVDVNVLVQNRTVPMIFSAYVPATVKIAVSRDKQIITPENLRIINGVDTLPIGVWDINANTVNGWTCLDWQTNFKDESMIDKKKFAMKLNGSDLRYAANNLPWEIEAGGELSLDLQAKIAYQLNARDLEEIMTVSFTMDWMDRVDFPNGKPHAKGTPMSKSRLDSLASTKTGNLAFSREAYNELKHGPAVDISDAQDRSVMCVTMGQDVIVYGDGGVKAPVSCYGLFSGYRFTTVDLSGLDTSMATDMSWMFSGTPVTSLDVSALDTSNVTNFYAIFYNMTKMKSITGLEHFDTSKVTNMEDVFEYCPALETISGLYGWDTSHVTTMSGMFYYVPAKVLDLSSFDTSAITHSFDHIFNYCKATTVYCRTQEDLNRFRSAGGNATGFVVGCPDPSVVS